MKRQRFTNKMFSYSDCFGCDFDGNVDLSINTDKFNTKSLDDFIKNWLNYYVKPR